MSNTSNIAALEATLTRLGGDFARGKAAPLDAGRLVFSNATAFAGTEGPAKAWGLYAAGQNEAKPGSIDTSDAKSAAMKTGRSKFNVFLRLAGSTVTPRRAELIDRTLATIAGMDKAPASEYEAVLKVIRLQLKAGNATVALTDDEIRAALTPAAQGELDAIDAIERAMKAYSEKYPLHAKGKFASAAGDIAAFRAERLEAHKAADAAAADIDA